MFGTAISILDEFCTVEEFERLAEEEFNRLRDPETKAVAVDELEEAVVARMLRQVEHHYPRFSVTGE